jgi:hypothetical protein
MPALLAPPRALPPRSPLAPTWPAAYPTSGIRTTALDVRSEDCAHDARMFVTRYCHACGFTAEICDSAVSCISEIAGNALHATFRQGCHRLFIQARQQWPFLVLRVHDPDPHIPVPRPFDLGVFLADPDLDVTAGGWGLASVVDFLADYREVTPTRRGKCTEVGFAVPWRSRPRTR